MNVQRIAASILAIALTSAAHRPAAIEPRAIEPPEWTLREELRLGDAAGTADDLRSVSAAVVRSDGAVGVVQRSDEVVVFDRSGRVRRRVAPAHELTQRAMLAQAESSLARARAGFPMEAVTVTHRVRAMGLLGDTIWVSGAWPGEIALLGEEGQVARALPFTAFVEDYASSAPLALLSDRSLLRKLGPDGEVVPRRLPAVVPPPPPDQYRMPVIPAPPIAEDEAPTRRFLVRASLDGRVIQGLEIFPEARATVTLRNPYGNAATVTYPFGDDPLIAATPDGSAIVFVERYAATRPGPAVYTIARFDVATGRRTGQRHEYVPEPVRPSTIDSLLDPLLDSLRAPGSVQFLEGFPSRAAARSALRAALDAPLYHTPFADVRAGADGTVWLRHRASDRWDAHTRDGRVAGRVTLPRGARLLYADGAGLWVAMAKTGAPRGDELLVRYHIVRP